MAVWVWLFISCTYVGKLRILALNHLSFAPLRFTKKPTKDRPGNEPTYRAADRIEIRGGREGLTAWRIVQGENKRYRDSRHCAHRAAYGQPPPKGHAPIAQTAMNQLIHNGDHKAGGGPEHSSHNDGGDTLHQEKANRKRVRDRRCGKQNHPYYPQDAKEDNRADRGQHSE